LTTATGIAATAMLGGVTPAAQAALLFYNELDFNRSIEDVRASFPGAQRLRGASGGDKGPRLALPEPREVGRVLFATDVYFDRRGLWHLEMRARRIFGRRPDDVPWGSLMDAYRGVTAAVEQELGPPTSSPARGYDRGAVLMRRWRVGETHAAVLLFGDMGRPWRIAVTRSRAFLGVEEEEPPEITEGPPGTVIRP
jgi:hypothetical protein